MSVLPLVIAVTRVALTIPTPLVVSQPNPMAWLLWLQQDVGLAVIVGMGSRCPEHVRFWPSLPVGIHAGILGQHLSFANPIG